MFSRILIVGLVAGFIAGLVLAAVQHVKVTPLITAAEVYEDEAAAHEPAHTHDRATAAHEHEAAWEPRAGFERVAFTFLADLIVAVGFGLVLSGSLAVRHAIAGHVPDGGEGLLWGFAGFAAFSLAPALGLPPQPPGMVAAAIYSRQAWWIGTAIATCAGLGLMVFCRHWALRAAGLVLLILPHFIGAPVRPAGDDAVTADIAARFVAASLVTSAVFWSVLGAVAGWLYAALEKRHAVLSPRPQQIG